MRNSERESWIVITFVIVRDFREIVEGLAERFVGGLGVAGLGPGPRLAAERLPAMACGCRGEGLLQIGKAAEPGDASLSRVWSS